MKSRRFPSVRARIGGAAFSRALPVGHGWRSRLSAADHNAFVSIGILLDRLMQAKSRIQGFSEG